MAFIDWRMRGVEVTNCNCDWGCPCQFNRLPTHGDCRACITVEIDKGHFGDVPLDGLRWAIAVAWPGAIHLGNGTIQAFIDERADAKQRAALEAVAHGRETEPGSLITQVFSTTMSRVLPTVTAPIEMRIDFDTRQASVRIGKIVEGTVGPMLNPVTGAAHHVRVTLPNGFEYTDAEYASGTTRGRGDIPLEFTDTHAHLTRIHWGTHGVVR